MIVFITNNVDLDTHFPSCGIITSGTANENVSRYTYGASGGISISGSINTPKLIDFVFGSGGIRVGGFSEGFRTIEKLCFKSQNKESGLSILFDTWDGLGNQLRTDVPATEVDSKGVYFLDYELPIKDNYLLMIAKEDDGDYLTPAVKKIGNPSTDKIYYADRLLRTGLTIAYKAYDINDSILQSGNLTEVGSGFYNADVTSLVGIYYFRVLPLTEVVNS